MSSVNITYHGRDFTKISDDLPDTIALTEGRTLNKKEQLNLLIKFLDSNKNAIDSLIVEAKQKNQLTVDKKTIYSVFNNEYYWTGLVGIFKGKIDKIYESDIQGDPFSGDENKEYDDIEITIQIQSRFDVYTDDFNNLKLGKPYFLATMLLKCSSGFNDQFVPNNSEDFFFDLLLLYLLKERANQCYLKGLYKTYQRFEENDDKIKGSIDISRHIRLNMGLDNGKVAYTYRENTVDNYLNHLILCAFEKIKKKYPDSVITVYNDPSNSYFKNLIESLNSKINKFQYDSRTLISKNLNPIAHPYYTEYEELRKISLRILRDEGVSIFDGSSEDVNGLLFYIPDLWELYLEHLIVDKEYILNSQGFNNDPVMVVNYKNDLASFKQKTYPDYVLSYMDSESNTKIPFMILDAKFKPDWAEAISQFKFYSNLLEDYDKCLRDMISINAHATGTIFPTNIDIVDKIHELISHDISKFNSIDKFYTFPIYVPESKEDESYNTWNAKFQKKNEAIIDLIKTYIVKEKDFTIKNKTTLDAIASLTRE